MTTTLRAVTAADAAAICAIYNEHVRASIVTFEEDPVGEDEMVRRIAELAPRLPWLVAEHGGGFAGYAYAAPWKARSAYRHTVETTIYLQPGLQRRGIGTALYTALLGELRRRGLHCALAGISLPNDASVALHERLGFRPAGCLHEVGRKFGRWIDVGYWERLLGDA